jgi:hypothetical protein
MRIGQAAASYNFDSAPTDIEGIAAGCSHRDPLALADSIPGAPQAK